MTDPTTNQPNKTSDLLKNMHDQMIPDPEVLKALGEKIEPKSDTSLKGSSVDLEPPGSTPPTQLPKKRRARILPMAIAAAASVAVLAVGLAVTLPALTGDPTTINANGGLTPSIASQVTSPGSYGELFTSIKDHTVNTSVYTPLGSFSESSPVVPLGELSNDASVPNNVNTTDSPKQESPQPQANAGDTAGATAADTSNNTFGNNESEQANPEFSQTNNQVANVDEGDVVKTDGKYIYILHNNQVIIATANGEDSQEVARFYAPGAAQKTYSAAINATDLYIHGNTLAIIYNYNDIADDADNYSLQNTSFSTRVALFDVSDASAPEPLHVWGQSGSLKQSRVYDGVLYLISNYSIYDYKNLRKNDPATYVPMLYSDTAKSDLAAANERQTSVQAERLLEPSEICILPNYTSAVYTVISSLDLQSLQRIDSQSILGDANTVYMSTDNLYVVEQAQADEKNVTERDLTSEYVETHSFTKSNISRFALDKGQISLAASASVPGSLLNQFSLDQYDGYLRVALTRNDFTSVYIQNKITGSRDYSNLDGFEGSTDTPFSLSPSNTSSVNDGQTNALVVLNSKLEVVGSIEGLAADERIYSVRFDGPLGYMVTFKQVDPLFTIDLSDPTQPQVLSALKIPGFSQYLHPYTPGRLLGLGMQADETTGRTSGMKLSMFNTSNPFNVSEQAKLDLDTDSSAALTNHKAILVDSSHNLIGFDAVTYNRSSSYSHYANYQYLVFGYSDLQGFYQRAAIELPADSNRLEANIRGLFVGDYFYISDGNNLGVFDLDTLETLAWINLATGANVENGGSDHSTESGSESELEPGGSISPRPLYLIE